MLESTYRAYGENDETIKTGTVKYDAGETDEQTVMNWAEAVVADVGEDRYQNEVYGIHD